MIIISFTITISWIKYSYKFLRLKDEEVVDMIEGSVLQSLSVSFLLPSCQEIPPEIAARFRHYIFAKIWYARQRAVYI